MFRALDALASRSPFRLSKTCFLIALAVLLTAATILPTQAGILSKEQVQSRFKLPYEVQDKRADLPVWPVTSTLEKEAGVVAYAYETIDIAPLPGFEGSPMNFLVSIDRHGNFMDVELLQQREPVFTFRDLGGYGDTLLRQFIAQYSGKSLNQPFVIALDSARNHAGGGAARGGIATLDGIAKATTSVRIVNQTVLNSALEVARAKLGFADRKNKGPAGKVRADVYAPLAFDDLLAKGMIGRKSLTNAEVEQFFIGTDGAGVDETALSHPDAVYVDLFVAYLNAPTIGRAILGDEQYKQVMARNFDERHLWWIGTAGRFQVVDDDFVAGAQSPLLAMSQDGGFLDFRDQGFEELQTSAPIQLNMSRIFGLRGDADVDPAAPLDIVLTITRAKGQMLPIYTTQKVKLTYAPPADLFFYPSKATPEWQSAWKDRSTSLGVIVAALLLLTIVLAKPRRIVASPERLRAFRLTFLAFTLLYLGWWAQGQLSIVQITGALKALSSGLGLSSYLYDPVSLVLIAFTIITFVLWGRGVFCGWLCPFGALQEFVGLLAEKLKMPQLTIPARIARPLERTRFLVLAVLAAAAVFAPHIGESLNEIEPFKTTFTHSFHRSAPFIGYVAVLLLIGAFYFKFFCRFLCPLGAAMSLGGRFRRLDWLTRRRECGAPCQLCKVACKYDAIEQDGRIRYDACYQCLDCVSLYHDENRCVPLVLMKKSGKVIASKNKGPEPCDAT